MLRGFCKFLQVGITFVGCCWISRRLHNLQRRGQNMQQARVEHMSPVIVFFFYLQEVISGVEAQMSGPLLPSGISDVMVILGGVTEIEMERRIVRVIAIIRTPSVLKWCLQLFSVSSYPSRTKMDILQ